MIKDYDIMERRINSMDYDALHLHIFYPNGETFGFSSFPADEVAISDVEDTLILGRPHETAYMELRFIRDSISYDDEQDTFDLRLLGGYEVALHFGEVVRI